MSQCGHIYVTWPDATGSERSLEALHAGLYHGSGTKGLRVRGRGSLRWGVPDLTQKELELVVGDTILVFKHLGLWKLAEENRKSSIRTGFLLESPMDPADYLTGPEAEETPSYFEWPQLRQMLEAESMLIVNFDQGSTGHERRKPTGLLTNLPLMEQLNVKVGGGQCGPILGELEERMTRSR